MGEIAALSASAFWAFASLLFAQLGRDTSAVALNMIKCAIAFALMLLTLAVLDGRIWPVELAPLDAGYLAISGFIGITIGDSAFFLALNRLGPRRVLLFSALTPPATAVMAVPVLGEPLTATMLSGMAVTMAGVVWVILERTTPRDETRAAAQPERDKRDEFWGIAFALVAVACQAGGNVLTKLGGHSIDALEISVVRLAAGVLGLVVVILGTRKVRELAVPFKTFRTAIMVVVATILGTYLGIWLLNAGLKYTFVGVASTLSSTSPIWILPLAYFILKEKISARAVFGAVIAVAGVAILFLM